MRSASFFYNSEKAFSQIKLVDRLVIFIYKS